MRTPFNHACTITSHERAKHSRRFPDGFVYRGETSDGRRLLEWFDCPRCLSTLVCICEKEPKQ